jgi:hypothetical protein
MRELLLCLLAVSSMPTEPLGYDINKLDVVVGDFTLPRVDPSTMVGKVLAGYQGWFRTPDDDDRRGWIHWTKRTGSLDPSLISEDYWPEMSEFTAPEQHAAPGFTNPDGSQANLFSSDNYQTVLRHFQWMQAWEIDGVGVQRFLSESSEQSRLRVLNYTLSAAVATGRIVFVEYDLSGMSESDVVSGLQRDWQLLYDTFRVTQNSQYLHQGALPVVGIYGFFLSRFSVDTANAILDIFQKGSRQAFVAGAGEWFWRSDPALSQPWIDMMYRMNSWQPWNCGNVAGDKASTGYWQADLLDFNGHGILYVPEIYPGASSNNRDSSPWGQGRVERRAGAFLWDQFAVATQIGAKTAFVGMFDELDEGTQIIKVSSTPPSQAHFIPGYDGLPSDVYLCLTSLGTKMLRGEIPYNETVPNCPSLTQPTVPLSLAPIAGDAVHDPFAFRWEPATTLELGGTISRYEIVVDNQRFISTTGPLSSVYNVTLGSGAHGWRIRAINSLGNGGPWSITQEFAVL